jgi:hypothetical protein
MAIENKHDLFISLSLSVDTALGNVTFVWAWFVMHRNHGLCTRNIYTIFSFVLVTE